MGAHSDSLTAIARRFDSCPPFLLHGVLLTELALGWLCISNEPVMQEMISCDRGWWPHLSGKGCIALELAFDHFHPDPALLEILAFAV